MTTSSLLPSIAQSSNFLSVFRVAILRKEKSYERYGGERMGSWVSQSLTLVRVTCLALHVFIIPSLFGQLSNLKLEGWIYIKKLHLGTYQWIFWHKWNTEKGSPTWIPCQLLSLSCFSLWPHSPVSLLDVTQIREKFANWFKEDPGCRPVRLLGEEDFFFEARCIN